MQWPPPARIDPRTATISSRGGRKAIINSDKDLVGCDTPADLFLWLARNRHLVKHEKRDDSARPGTTAPANSSAIEIVLGENSPDRTCICCQGIGHLISQHDQNDGRRNDLSQRARRSNRSPGQRWGHAIADQARQCQQTQRDDTGTDDPGRTPQAVRLPALLISSVRRENGKTIGRPYPACFPPNASVPESAP